MNCKRTIRKKAEVIFKYSVVETFCTSKEKHRKVNILEVWGRVRRQVQIPALALFSCIASGKLPKLSVP